MTKINQSSLSSDIAATRTDRDMDRRDTLRLLGAAVLGISLPCSTQPPSAIRVIGVGDAGCNTLLTAWSGGTLQTEDHPTKFACVTMGQYSRQAIRQANQLCSGRAPIREVQIGQSGACGSVPVAWVAARRYDSALRSLVEDVEVVILVAGLGGGTGSGVTPLLASMAKGVGALVLAVVVTPFRWEIDRYPNAFQALKEMKHECDYTVSLSNQALADSMGDDALLEAFIAMQELEGTESIRKLVKSGIRYCRDRRARSA